MIPSAVPRAAVQGSQSATEAAVTDPHARCFPQYARSAAKKLKYPSNLAVISQCTVAIATVKSDRAHNASLTSGIHGPGIPGPCMSLEYNRKLRERSINMKIYVGNLSYEVTEEELRKEFEAFGEVASVSIITDRYSGQSKGFGFIEMASVTEGQAAITGINGKTLKDRTLNVNAARPRSDSGGGRSYGEGRSGRFGGGRQRRY